MLIKIYVVKLVLIILTYVVKSESTRTEVVDGSNESSYYPDEKMDPSLRKMTFAKKFDKSGCVEAHSQHCYKLRKTTALNR